MKTTLFLCAAICATLSFYPQKSQMKPTGKENLKMQLNIKAEEDPAIVSKVALAVNPSPLQPSSAKISAVNTWSNVTTSPSPFGSLISYCKPLHYNDELDAVCFIHRRPNNYVTSPPSVGPSQQVNALISGNFGNTWDSTLVWDDVNNWARYPGGGIYNPPGNSLISAAFVVVAGPTTPAAGGWNGNFYGSKSLASFNNTASAVPNAQQWMDITNPNPNVGRHDFAAYAYTSTDDGKMRNLAGVKDDGTGGDTAVMLITGTFNSGVFAYSGTRFNPPSTSDGAGDDNWLSRPIMAWNEAGTVGYIAVMGQRTGATGRNTGLQPMVWKTTNSGASWALLAGIDFNTPAYSNLVYHLTAQGSSTLEVPNFLWTEGIDMAVDANDRLHLFTALVGHYSVDPDSLFYTSGWGTDGYKWPHVPGLRPYLYDFITDGTSAWTYNTIDSMSSEGASDNPSGAGFNENPWSLAGTNKVRLDARLQMSRTPNGKYLFYSWTESDTNFTNNAVKFNVLPNIKVRAFGIDEDEVSLNEENITSPVIAANPNVASKAFWHFMSTKSSTAIVAIVGPSLTTISAKIPFTTSNNPGLISSGFSTTHWYNTSETTFSFAANPVSIAESGINKSVTSSVIYPNPARDHANLAIELKNNEKIVLQVCNIVGEVIKEYSAEGQRGQNIMSMDLTGLTNGIYFVQIHVGNAISTQKLLVE